MARRGCASGRRMQLRRLKKALFEHKEFDPSIFNQSISAPKELKTPTYKSYVAPAPKELITKTTPAPISRSKFRTPAHPKSLDVAPVRLPIRPLPTSKQIKDRVVLLIPTIRPIKTITEKPKIRAMQSTNISIQNKKKGWISIKRRNPENS